MMKKIRLTYTFLLAAALLMLTACSSDDATQGGGETLDDGSIKIHLRVAAAGSGTMRAWTDNASATTEEMMNVWTVVAVNTADNKVAKIYACKPSGDPDQEIDVIAELPSAGSYRFYSFANMSPKVVMNLLGISGSGNASGMRDGGTSYPTGPNDPTQGGNSETGGGNDNDNNSALGSVTNNGGATDVDDFITNDNTYGKNKLCDIEFTESTVTAASVEAKEVNVAGNNFDLTTHNGFGATGIPMSNVQTKTVSDGSNVELVVIRMMAKIELQVYNDKGSDVTVESFTLTDVTKNSDGNLKLLPSLSDAGHDVMTIPTHGDISPNLGTSTSKGDIKLYPNGNGTVSASANNTTAGTPKKFTFYVNESVKPTNAFNHFFLKIKLAGEAEERYVLIDDKGSTTTDDNKWDYIARNDYRIIPIVLDDYKLDMIPYDFPAIGVYPASVKEEDGIYTINFHDYGHFHLQPVVKKVSDSSVVPFTPTTPDYSSTTWGLIDNDFSKSWGSWTDATKATAYDNEADTKPFYRKGYTVNPPVDGDEVGGIPVWYPNDGSAGPQWDPTASGSYAPFIFGYIEDPAATLTEDKKVYHEFSIYLYKKGMSAPRQMTYRLYMILDTDQMMYSRMFGAPRVRHTHGY